MARNVSGHPRQRSIDSNAETAGTIAANPGHRSNPASRDFPVVIRDTRASNDTRVIQDPGGPTGRFTEPRESVIDDRGAMVGDSRSEEGERRSEASDGKPQARDSRTEARDQKTEASDQQRESCHKTTEASDQQRESRHQKTEASVQ